MKENESRIARFARHVLGKPLYPYQAEIAGAILSSIFNGEGKIFSVMMARQMGKNQLSAVIEAYLLTCMQEGTIVKAAPTFTPQIINSRLRLLSLLDTPLTRDRVWTSNGYILGLAPRAEAVLLRAHSGPRVMFYSASPESNVVGATADLLLEIDEAQDVSVEKFDRDFRPMAATRNATTVLYGTAWSDDTLLAQQRASNLALQDSTGERRHFEYDWRVLAALNPAYRAFVEQEIARLGEDHLHPDAILPASHQRRWLPAQPSAAHALAGNASLARRANRRHARWLVCRGYGCRRGGTPGAGRHAHTTRQHRHHHWPRLFQRIASALCGSGASTVVDGQTLPGAVCRHRRAGAALGAARARHRCHRPGSRAGLAAPQPPGGGARATLHLHAPHKITPGLSVACPAEQRAPQALRPGGRANLDLRRVLAAASPGTLSPARPRYPRFLRRPRRRPRRLPHQRCPAHRSPQHAFRSPGFHVNPSEKVLSGRRAILNGLLLLCWPSVRLALFLQIRAPAQQCHHDAFNEQDANKLVEGGQRQRQDAERARRRIENQADLAWIQAAKEQAIVQVGETGMHRQQVALHRMLPAHDAMHHYQRHIQNGNAQEHQDEGKLRAAHDRQHGQRDTQKLRAAIPHDDARRIPVVGQKARHRAGKDGRQQRDAILPQRPANDGDKQAGNRHNARRQAIQPVDKIDGVHHAHNPEPGE